MRGDRFLQADFSLPILITTWKFLDLQHLHKTGEITLD
jgi:hypothetical protein